MPGCGHAACHAPPAVRAWSHANQPLWKPSRRVATEQDGFVTAAQAAQVGVDYPRLTRLVSAGFLVRVEHGVYKVAVGVPTISRVQEWLYVKYLALDRKRLPWKDVDRPGVVLSHESAGDILGIGVMPADVAVFTSARRRNTTIPGIRLHTAALPEGDWSYVAGGRLPVTTAARTVVDLALYGIERDCAW